MTEPPWPTATHALVESQGCAVLIPVPVTGTGSRFSGQVQVVPLIANDVGLAWLLVHVPWKPSVMLPPGAMVPL